MTNTFLNRVSAERRVLAVVNAKTPKARQLTGLSRAAIQQWQVKVGFEQTADAFPELMKIAELCQRLSDRSHETFLPVDVSLSKQIEWHIKKLQTSVAMLR